MKIVAVAVAATFALAACSTDPYTGEQKVSNAAIGVTAGAVLGGVTGALIGKGDRGSRRGALIGAGIGALAGGGIGLYMDKQEADLRRRLERTGVSVTRVGDDIILNMPSNVTFDVDRAEVRPDFHATLDSVAIVLDEYNRTLVDVEGHTDSDGADDYNYELSDRRAQSVARYLVRRDLNPDRFYVTGMGERQPIASNASAGGKAQNRRVEIKITPLT